MAWCVGKAKKKVISPNITVEVKRRLVADTPACEIREVAVSPRNRFVGVIHVNIQWPALVRQRILPKI